MPLVPMTKLLAHARENRYAVGYFESWNLESLLAVKDAAEKADSPVIIGFNGRFLGNQARRVREDVRVYGRLGAAVAERSAVPMALILNEADDTDLLLKGLEAGFNVIMHEGCALDDSIRINTSLVRSAHSRGAEVEAEIGELPHAEGGGGKIRGGWKTDPAEAERLVSFAGVDALAVSVGNVHVLEGRKARLDLALVEKLASRLPVPLVLHGGTGIDEGDLRQAIRLGISKINVGTALRRAFINSLRDYLQTHEVERLDPGEVTSTGGREDMLAAARLAVASEVVKLMEVFGSPRRAAGIR
jgi:fructose-bisphosphate aldolase class II